MSSSSSSLSSQQPSPIFILNNSKQITCLVFSTFNDEILYSGNREGDLTIYNLKQRRVLFNQTANKQSILSIAELDSNTFLTYTRNGAVYRWQRRSESDWTFNCVYENEVFTFAQFNVNREKKLMFVPSTQSSLFDCVDLNTYHKVNSTKLRSNERGMLMNLKTIDENSLLAGFENGELVLYDLREFEEVSSADLFKGQPLMCFDYCKKVNLGLAASTECLVQLFQSQNNSLKISNSIALTNPGLNCVKIREGDSKIFATGGWDSRVRVYGVKRQNLLAVLDFHKEPINTIDFSPTNLMAIGSNDGIVSFWNLYNKN